MSVRATDRRRHVRAAALAAAGPSFIWWRYHQSAKSLTIMAENINLHESEELKAAIQQSAQDNYVGPWLSSFLKRRGL